MVAAAFSGGGYRAMLGTAATLSWLKESGLLDVTVYAAGLSGYYSERSISIQILLVPDLMAGRKDSWQWREQILWHWERDRSMVSVY